jgi:hypothetical protein
MKRAMPTPVSLLLLQAVSYECYVSPGVDGDRQWGNARLWRETGSWWGRWLTSQITTDADTPTTTNKDTATTTNNVAAFLQWQGVELTVRCTVEKVHAWAGALKVISFAVSSPFPITAEVLVEAEGFNTIFRVSMGPKPARCSNAPGMSRSWPRITRGAGG